MKRPTSGGVSKVPARLAPWHRPHCCWNRTRAALGLGVGIDPVPGSRLGAACRRACHQDQDQFVPHDAAFHAGLVGKARKQLFDHAHGPFGFRAANRFIAVVVALHVAILERDHHDAVALGEDLDIAIGHGVIDFRLGDQPAGLAAHRHHRLVLPPVTRRIAGAVDDHLLRQIAPARRGCGNRASRSCRRRRRNRSSADGHIR